MPRRSKWDIADETEENKDVTNEQIHQQQQQQQQKHYQHHNVQGAPGQNFSAYPSHFQTQHFVPYPPSHQYHHHHHQTHSQHPPKINILEQDIEINDCRNRFIITKATTIMKIQDETGATITRKGRYYNKKMGEEPLPGDERPLYLHLAAETQESMDKAIEKIKAIMNQQPTFHTEKVFVGIENVDPSFNIPANIIGPKGTYVKHITQTCGGTRVQLKGKNSGYKEPETGQELDEPMHLVLTSSSKINLEKAKGLVDKLLDKVKKDYNNYLNNKKKKMNQTPNIYNYYSNPYNYPYYQNYYGAYAVNPSTAEPPPPGSEPSPPGSEPPPPGSGSSYAIPPPPGSVTTHPPSMVPPPQAAAAAAATTTTTTVAGATSTPGSSSSSSSSSSTENLPKPTTSEGDSSKDHQSNAQSSHWDPYAYYNYYQQYYSQQGYPPAPSSLSSQQEQSSQAPQANVQQTSDTTSTADQNKKRTLESEEKDEEQDVKRQRVEVQQQQSTGSYTNHHDKATQEENRQDKEADFDNLIEELSQQRK